MAPAPRCGHRCGSISVSTILDIYTAFHDYRESVVSGRRRLSPTAMVRDGRRRTHGGRRAVGLAAWGSRGSCAGRVRGAHVAAGMPNRAEHDACRPNRASACGAVRRAASRSRRLPTLAVRCRRRGGTRQAPPACPKSGRNQPRQYAADDAVAALAGEREHVAPGRIDFPRERFAQ